MHKFIRKNKVGRDFVVGDVHGRYDLLKQAMEAHAFDKKKDRLFSVGDIVNRGPESEKCLKLLKKKWFFMVLGNHEMALLEAIENKTLKTYARQYDNWVRKVPRKDLKAWGKLLSKCPISITVKGPDYTCGICHAEPDGNAWKKTRDRQKSRWVMLMGRRTLRRKTKTKVRGVDFTIHGHTPLEKSKWVANRFFIDTGAWYSDKLTFKALDDVYASHKKREVKHG